MAMTANNSNVVQFPAQSNIATAIQSDKTNLTNLGSQISQLVQHYNTLKQQLMANPDKPTRDQLSALLEQRRAGIQVLVDAHQAAIAQLRATAQQNHVAVDVQLPSVTLQGLGQIVDTSSIQTAIATEEAKLSALQTYYTAYQQAVAANQPLPPLPPELESGLFGMSGTTLALLAAAVVGGLFFFKGK